MLYGTRYMGPVRFGTGQDVLCLAQRVGTVCCMLLFRVLQFPPHPKQVHRSALTPCHSVFHPEEEIFSSLFIMPPAIVGESLHYPYLSRPGGNEDERMKKASCGLKNDIHT